MTEEDFRKNPPYGFTAVELPSEEEKPKRSDFSIALTEALEAELATFGEEILWRKTPTKAIAGTSKETKAMMAAGYYENATLNLLIVPTDSIPELEDTSPPKVNELLTLRESTWRITQVDQLELAHGFQLTIEKLP